MAPAESGQCSGKVCEIQCNTKKCAKLGEKVCKPTCSERPRFVRDGGFMNPSDLQLLLNCPTYAQPVRWWPRRTTLLAADGDADRHGLLRHGQTPIDRDSGRTSDRPSVRGAPRTNGPRLVFQRTRSATDPAGWPTNGRNLEEATELAAPDTGAARETGSPAEGHRPTDYHGSPRIFDASRTGGNRQGFSERHQDTGCQGYRHNRHRLSAILVLVP
jgi:hypothetical protein